MLDKLRDGIRKQLEVHDVKITGVEVSGDGENWTKAQDMWSHGSMGNFGDGLAHLIDLLAAGETVYIRVAYVEIYKNGRNGLPKSGAVYKLDLLECMPARKLIETTAAPALPAGEKKEGE